MKKNQKGFTIFEILVVIFIVGLICVVGWLVYDRQKSNKNVEAPAPSTSKAQADDSAEIPKTNTYNFSELGITMDILEGWEVKSEPNKDEGTNTYFWEVTKPNSDGKILLRSWNFQGGFSDCSLTSASIIEVAQTKNKNLLFLSWTNTINDETEAITELVRSDGEIFKSSNNEKAASIKNSELKPGNYYYCAGYPGPGFSLDLNSEPTAYSYSRKDSIYAKYVSTNDYLDKSAESYNDIKAMLTSVK